MAPPSLDTSSPITLPGSAASRLRSSTQSPRPRSAQKKPWQSRRMPSFQSTHSRNEPVPEEETELSHIPSRASTARERVQKRKWWKIQLFRGMMGDIRRRAPFYLSDWRDAWDYRVVPATVYMYFANILPALAFSLDMFAKTDQSFGVNEVLLASVLGSVVFSLFAGQPLTIVGVTGPITVFNYTVYDIVVPHGINYFAFMCWIGIWSLIMHWGLAIANACDALTYVTRFSCDTFGFYVAFIYLQKGIQVLTRQWGSVNETSAYLSIAVALLVLMCGYGCGVIGNSNLFQRYVRKFIEDYGTPLTIIFFTGFVHIGHMRDVDVATLPTSKAFFPTQDRGWLVHFWDISVGDVFLAIPFAVLLTILFYFDHNVSSLIAQGTEFPLRKPAGFHWDIFLLGITTFIAGLLGIPFPNGLIPQAPFHTNSLCATRQTVSSDEDPDSSENKGHHVVIRVVDHVVEQRASNLGQGILTLGTMTGPLLVVLHLIPQAVLAGLFFIMGVQALESNGITVKMLFLAKERSLTPKSDPLGQIRRRAVYAFVACELIGFGATFAITQTIAAIGFPVIILLLVPIRTFLMPRWFSPQELAILDAPTASPFTMESVGGVYGGSFESDESLPVSSSTTTTPPTDVKKTLSRQHSSDHDGKSPDYDDNFSSHGDHHHHHHHHLHDDAISISVVEDTLERGEAYEMYRPGLTRRRSSASHGEPHLHRPGHIRRRSSMEHGEPYETERPRPSSYRRTSSIERVVEDDSSPRGLRARSKAGSRGREPH